MENIIQNFLAETKHKHHCDCYLLNFDEIPYLDNSIRNKLKKITNYSNIRNEFRIIDEWLKFIIGDYKDIDRIFFNKEFLIVRKGIWFSSIILYGKAFVAGKRTNLKDKIKDIFKGNDRLKSVHEDILRYRHNFVAHSKDLDLSRTFLYLSLRIDKKELMDLENFYYRLEELSIDQYKDFQRLVWHVHNWIDNEIVKFDKYIVKEVKEKLNTDDLYKYKLEK